MSLIVVNIGAAKLDLTNNALTYQVKGLPGKDEQDAPELGYVPVWLGAGDASYPAAGTQGIYDEDLQAITGFRSVGIADFYGVMKPGDEAKGTTDAAHSARTFWKAASREVTTLVKDPDGKDVFQTLSGSAEKFQVGIGGCAFEVGKDGVLLTTPGGYIQIKMDGTIYVNGTIVYLGQAPTLPVAVGPGTPLNTTSTSVIA